MEKADRETSQDIDIETAVLNVNKDLDELFRTYYSILPPPDNEEESGSDTPPNVRRPLLAEAQLQMASAPEAAAIPDNNQPNQPQPSVKTAAEKRQEEHRKIIKEYNRRRTYAPRCTPREQPPPGYSDYSNTRYNNLVYARCNPLNNKKAKGQHPHNSGFRPGAMNNRPKNIVMENNTKYPQPQNPEEKRVHDEVALATAHFNAEES
jgi:hypothetical protein